MAYSFQWKQAGKTGALAKAWEKAEDEDERDEVRKKVHKFLSGQFDTDMKRREKELEKVEARLNKLRKQLDKRVANKDDIVELQLKQLTMSWDGLGWSDPDTPITRSFTGRGGPGGGAFGTGLATAPSFPQPPAPPMGMGTASVPKPDNLFTSESTDLLDEIIEAASDSDAPKLRTLASKLAEQAEEMESVPANDAIWRVYEEVGDLVDDKKFWLTLAKAAENAADDVDDSRTLGNILDTAARCYHLGGKSELALELQSTAVEASAEANDGEPNEQIVEFLEELKELTSEDNELDQNEGDSVR